MAEFALVRGGCPPHVTLRTLAVAALVGCWLTPVHATEPAVTGASLATTTDATRRRDENVQLVERVKNAVVNIHSERTVSQNPDDPFRPGIMQPQRVNGMGTGIVLDPRGYLVTNYHVVDDVNSLRCRLADGTNLTARVIATDKESDLALIKIDPPKPLPVVPLGTAQDLMLAEKVLAIGNAFGYEHTVTVGTVSALKRDVSLNKEISYRSLIQTQTPINPGNSGGPLFNKLGEVVGVNVAIRAGAQNIAFAIPVDTMIAKAADMLSGRRRAGMRCGLTLLDRYDRGTEDGPLRRWLTVSRVDGGSAAEQAGLKPDDVIEQVGDVGVRTSIDFERGFLDKPAKAKVRVKRGAESFEVELAGGTTPTVGTERAAAVSSTNDQVWAKIGLKAAPVGANLVQVVDKQLRGGLWVSDLAPLGVAAKAGLLKGDILLGMHQWETVSLDNVTYVITHKDLATFNPVRVIFVRDGKIREAQMQVGE
jgi:serine protease Do